MVANRDPEFLRSFAKAIVDKTERENPRPFLSPATVTGGNPGLVSGAIPYLTVHVDGDPPDATAQIPSLIGMRAPGTRVMIFWDRPHGAYVMGATSAAVPVGRQANGCDDGENVFLPFGVRTPIPFCCPEFSAAGVDVTNPNYISIPGSATYAASLNVRWNQTVLDTDGLVHYLTIEIEVQDENGNPAQIVATGTSIDTRGQIVISSCAFQTPPNARLVAFATQDHPEDLYLIPKGHFETVFVTDPLEAVFCEPDGGGG